MEIGDIIVYLGTYEKGERLGALLFCVDKCRWEKQSESKGWRR